MSGFTTPSGRDADACDLFTTADYEKLSKIAADPAAADREYSVNPAKDPANKCTRDAAGSDVAPDPGTTILDGGFSPTVDVARHSSAAAARRNIEGKYNDLVRVGGVGDVAYFDADPQLPKLLVAVGAYSFELDVVQTNGTADWSVTKYRTLLIDMAKAIAPRLR